MTPHDPELVREIVRRVKALEQHKSPTNLPADSFLEACAHDILAIVYDERLLNGIEIVGYPEGLVCRNMLTGATWMAVPRGSPVRMSR